MRRGKVPQGPKIEMQLPGQEISKPQVGIILKVYTENITVYNLVPSISIQDKPLSERLEFGQDTILVWFNVALVSFL